MLAALIGTSTATREHSCVTRALLVEILLKIYAKCLDGGTELPRQRVQTALGHGRP